MATTATKKAHTRKSRKLTIKQEPATRPTAEAVKKMTPAQRKRLADRLVPGLAGQARQNWIDTGKTFNEQLVEYRIDQLIKAGWNAKYVREAARRKPQAFANGHIAPDAAGAPEEAPQETARDRKRKARAERQIARAKARAEKEATKSNTKETTVKTKTTTKPATKTITVNVITPADIAAEAGTTPKRVRIYLRANNIAKTNGHYSWNKRDARKLITAIRKEVTA